MLRILDEKQDAYNAFYDKKMDFGDALLIVEGLIKAFNLSPEVISKMSKKLKEKL